MALINPEPLTLEDWIAACRLAVEQRDIARAQLQQINDLCALSVEWLDGHAVIGVDDVQRLVVGG